MCPPKTCVTGNHSILHKALLSVIIFKNRVCVSFDRRRRDGRDEGVEQAGADCLHERAARRAGEGVPLQPLPVSAAPHRDGGAAESDRATDQDLVPEPADEVQEGAEAETGQQARRRHVRGTVPWVAVRRARQVGGEGDRVVTAQRFVGERHGRRVPRAPVHASGVQREHGPSPQPQPVRYQQPAIIARWCAGRHAPAFDAVVARCSLAAVHFTPDVASRGGADDDAADDGEHGQGTAAGVASHYVVRTPVCDGDDEGPLASYVPAIGGDGVLWVYGLFGAHGQSLLSGSFQQRS